MRWLLVSHRSLYLWMNWLTTTANNAWLHQQTLLPVCPKSKNCCFDFPLKVIHKSTRKILFAAPQVVTSLHMHLQCYTFVWLNNQRLPPKTCSQHIATAIGLQPPLDRAAEGQLMRFPRILEILQRELSPDSPTWSDLAQSLFPPWDTFHGKASSNNPPCRS